MIFALIARLGVPQRLIGPVLGTGAVLLLALCAWLWLRSHDAKVIDTHEAGITEQVTTATTAANDAANANDTKRQADNARADEQLRGTIDAAAKDHPEEVRRPAGPAVSGTLDRLRERQTSPRAPAH